MEIRNQGYILSPVQYGRQGSLHLAFSLDGLAVGPRIRVVVSSEAMDGGEDLFVDPPASSEQASGRGWTEVEETFLIPSLGRVVHVFGHHLPRALLPLHFWHAFFCPSILCRFFVHF